jgi:hypothetical protein
MADPADLTQKFQGVQPISDDEKIIGMHNTNDEKLAKANALGGYPVPSLALAKIKHGMNSFGDVSLIAPPELVTPGKGNPVFGSDVYSPRFPSLNDEGTKIFRGFTDMGNRRYAPLTMNNAVREMKGAVRGAEGHNYGAGSVRAMVTPKFRNLRDIQKARGKLITKEEFEPLRKKMNDTLDDLAEKFQPHSKYFGSPTQHHFAFPDLMAEAASKGLHSFREHYKDTLPPEHIQAAGKFLNTLRDMPTEYFEAKPQRGVGIHEFRGAIVPHAAIEKVGPILDRHGVKRIEQYGGHGDTEGRKAALKKFSDQGFAEGGKVDDPDQPQRQLSPVGLYSHAADVVQRFPQMRGTPQQFKAMLTKQGVKPDEFKYSNYDQKFAGKPMVTKDELAQHFQSSLPPVQETTLGGKKLSDRYQVKGQGAWVPLIDTHTGREISGGMFGPMQEQADELNAKESGHQNYLPTKYHQYNLPGGTNYRETLLHLPPNKQVVDDVALAKKLKENFGHDWETMSPAQREIMRGYERKMPDENAYKSSHWDTPNVLAHLRMSDRALPGGQKALHLEELQSDWAQAARKNGIRVPGDNAKAAEINRRMDELSTRHGDWTTVANLPEHQELGRQLNEASTKNPNGVPAAPYVDSTQKWVDLGLKRALHEAAKGGYHKLVVTPGEEQAKRYDLSKHVRDLSYEPDAKLLQGRPVSGHRTDAIIHHDVGPEKLPDIVGKEVAQRLLASPRQKVAHLGSGLHHHLPNEELKVGGEGMKAFYDRMLPAALEKLAKKHDPEAKVGMTHIKADNAPEDVVEKWAAKDPDHPFVKKNRLPVHSLDITPKMRASILAGQPAYAGGGKVEIPEVAAPEPAKASEPSAVPFADLKRIGETWGYNSPHFIKAREAHEKPPEPEPKADGGPVEAEAPKVEAEKPEERIVGALKDWLREEHANGGVVGAAPHMHAGAGSGAGRLEKMRRQSGDLSPNQRVLPLDGDPLIEKALALAQDATAYKNGGAVEKAADKQELEKLEATIARQGDAIDKLTRLLSAPQIVERDENNRIKRIYREMPK